MKSDYVCVTTVSDIEKYLGPGYVVRASVGHLKEERYFNNKM